MFFLKNSVTSYIVSFTPDGSMVGRDKKVAAEIDNKGGV